MRTYCTLYVFTKPVYNEQEPCGVRYIKVARLTTGLPEDWYLWPDRYLQDHPKFQLLEISGIEFVDEREPAPSEG